MHNAPVVLELWPEPGNGGAPSFPPSSGAAPGVVRAFYAPGQSLSQAVYLSGLFSPPPLCSGLARCGRCGMRVLGAAQEGHAVPPPHAADTAFFSPQDIALGWRLACRHQPKPGMLVELPPGTALMDQDPCDAGLAAPFVPDPALPPLFLAVDLGTTSLHWLLFRADGSGSNGTLEGGVMVNPQMGAGTDVVSRISAARAPGGQERMRRVTLRALRALLRGAHNRHGPVSALCLAANTAMTALTLGVDVSGLAAAPYALPHPGGDWVRLEGLPPVWLPPQLSPFVGGDIAAGYASLALHPGKKAPPFPFLLADMGTNGEFLLALSPQEAISASVALGPALEGIGLSHGTEARSGAVTAFSLTPRGLGGRVLLADGSLDDFSPGSPARHPLTGISGTGYLSLLHVLLRCNAINRDGNFTPESCGPLRRFFTPVRDAANHAQAFLTLPEGMRLYASDIEETLKVKAAFSLGLTRLLEHAGIAFKDLAGICLAGSLGRHVDPEALEGLGFFPPGASGRIEPVGNSSLSGAALLAWNPEARAQLSAWAANVSALSLVDDPEFINGFASHMRFA